MSGVELVLGGSGVLLACALLAGAVLLARSLAATRTELARAHARLDAQALDRSGREHTAPLLPVPVVTDLGTVTGRPADTDYTCDLLGVPASHQLAEATLQQPLIRVAVWSAGVRHAMRPESRDRARALARREYRRRSKLRRRAARQAARAAAVSPMPWTETETETESRDERAS